MKMKKRALSLLEIIIVIFLITLITGAVGYSMKGTLDKGRAFRTEQAIEQLHDLLHVCVAEGHTVREVADSPQKFLEQYKLAKNPEKLVQDGWGLPLVIKQSTDRTDFVITSRGLARYKRETNQEDEPAGDSDAL